MVVRGTLILLVGVLAASCGSDGNGSSSPAGTSHCGSTEPAASVDVNVCKSVVDDHSLDAATACRKCCTDAGLPDAGFSSEDQCVCGTAPTGNSKTACASKTASETECGDCCDAGYVGYVYGTGVCQCGPKKDAAVCACALSDPDPYASCSACCLHHGYLGVEYIGIGTPECGCVGG